MDSKLENQRRHHDHRIDLAGEHPWNDAIQLILLSVFIAGMVGDLFFLDISHPLQALVPLYIRIIFSIPVLITSGYFARSGLRKVFREERPELEIISSDVFSIVRHPIYLGSILLYVVFLIVSLSLIALGIWIVIVIYYYYVSKFEEHLLIHKLGEAYLAYKREVPMFIPRIMRK